MGGICLCWWWTALIPAGQEGGLMLDASPASTGSALPHPTSWLSPSSLPWRLLHAHFFVIVHIREWPNKANQRPNTSSWPGCRVGVFAVIQCSLGNPIGWDQQALGTEEMKLLSHKDKSSFSDRWFGLGGSFRDGGRHSQTVGVKSVKVAACWAAGKEWFSPSVVSRRELHRKWQHWGSITGLPCANGCS